jgi:NAD(P)-dependent dehydrogenase (short-subunit alcohol dehydrogenase family)
MDTLLVGSAAPFVLLGRLKAAMLASPFVDRYVVNVTGLDGRFDVRHKHPLHPHVNISKAALNMLTRTTAESLAKDGIYVNSVDVGWVSLEAGTQANERARRRGVCPPLLAEDAAARIVDPIAMGLQGQREHGKIFRDFRQATW